MNRICVYGTAIAAAIMATGIGGERLARADVTTVYAGSGCKVMLDSDVGNVTRVNGHISVPAGKPATEIMCPVAKLTSGPSITTDQIFQTQISQLSTKAGDVVCTMRAFRAPINFVNDRNLLEARPVTSPAGSGQMTIAGLSQAGWWQTSQMWKYPVMTCLLKPGGTLNNYAVSERGTAQPNHQIFSPAHCTPSADSSYQGYNGDQGSGGYWDANGLFKLSCPIPSTAARGVQAMVGPSMQPTDPLRYSVAGSGFTKVPPNPSNAEFPTKIVIHSYPAGAQTLSFDQGSVVGNGDAKLLSYRTMPVVALPRDGWGASAFRNSADAPLAIDANTTNRWTSGVAQANAPAPGQWFDLDLRGPNQQFLRIVLDSTASAGDFPRAVQIFASSDGVNWGSAIASSTGTSDIVTIPLPPTIARYVRIKQTGTSSKWWSITRIDLFGVQ